MGQVHGVTENQTQLSEHSCIYYMMSLLIIIYNLAKGEFEI